MAEWERSYGERDYQVGSCIPLGVGPEDPITGGVADEAITKGNWAVTRFGLLEKIAIDHAIARLNVSVAAKRRDVALRDYADLVAHMNTARNALDDALDAETEKFA